MKQKLGLVLSTLMVLMLVVSKAEAQKKPNIIYILADDMGYNELGCYGQKTIKTPNIDKLAANGMMFTNHHSGSTVCAPSRGVLLTGKHTGHSTVRANGDLQNIATDGSDITLAQLLKDIGYHTAMVGKASTGCNVELGQPNKVGFDYFFGLNGHAQAHHYFPPVVYRNDEVIKYPNNKKHTGDTYIHDEFLKEITNYISEHGKDDQPFFLHYSALIPHASLYAPEEWVAQYRDEVDEVGPYKGGHYAKVKEPKATAAGMISRLDWEVGKIMQQLKDLGIAHNTLVIFSSDNGPHSAGGKKIQWFDSNGVYRGKKRDLFEGGVRVPMIATWPGEIKPGTKTDHMSAFWDVLPTLCDITGAEAPNDIDGISFLPTLEGKPKKQKQHDYLYWEFYEGGGKRAVLTKDWKAVQLRMKKGGDPIMLFNLKKDISEQKNVANKYPEVVKEFEKIFKKAHTDSPLISW